jgi:error-prone DNA polymerase
LGVILYQEQVIQAAMAVAGFTAGQADQMRRAMSRKRSREAMAAMWEEFRQGALGQGVEEKTARTVFDKIMGFAEFGFPKSHSAAFALLAYQSAWLKKYYPLEFTCALLNAQPMGFYPPEVIVGDARRHGVELLPPDINLSRRRCAVESLPAEREGEAVRTGQPTYWAWARAAEPSRGSATGGPQTGGLFRRAGFAGARACGERRSRTSSAPAPSTTSA